ncbi:ABC transporter family substrate-binding protein [Citricoccus sp. GCM10030269]|uniref:ABC transporter family substrate-binding protein n=1 Tax=Citricoccus sp. GCM10030269 TaxID=3273388 RepID=UPI00360A8F43
MKYTKLSAAAALLASSALVMTACAPGGPAEENESGNASEGGNGETITGEAGQKLTAEPADTGLADLGDIETQDGSISYSVGEDEFISYNSMTPETYSTYNSAVTERIISQFAYFGTDGEIYQNEEYGTYEKISDDPLQVKYTLNEDAVWSDGTPVTAADYILKWAAENPRITNADGDPLFNAISQEYGSRVPEAPEGEADGKEFTITFDEPYADWPILLDTAQPAHVVAEQSGMGMDEMIEAIRNEDSEALAPAAEFWNTGWNTSPGTLPDEEIAPSNGPYKFKSWEPGQSITLEANDQYWGTPPATQELVIRFAAADTHVQALENGDLDVVEPQATVDTLEQLKGLGDQVVVQQGSQLTWEHLDFNFMDGSLFADSPELREAFALCVPRQQIVDNLIKPLDPEATVLNAREVFPFQDSYQEVVEASYDGRYDEVDLDRASQLVEESGADDLTVRIGYSSPNPRRSETVSMIKSSCDEAGFDVVDAGHADFFGVVQPQGDWEVALFAWAGSGQIASGRNIYHSDGPQNYGEFSSEDVDAAWDTLASSVDPEVHAEQTKKIEKLLWDELFGIPLYTHPGVVAHSADIANVRQTSTQSGAVWNAQQWLRAE